MSCSYRQVGSLISALVLAPAINADVSAEREALARLVHELQAIEALIHQAQAQHDHDSRIQFR